MARLHSRIYLHFVGVLLVVGLTSAAVFAVGTRDGFRREVAARLTRHLAALAGEHVGDPTALTERLRQLHRDLRLDLRVRDLEGRTIASVGERLPRLTRAEESDVRAGRVVMRAHPMPFAAAPIRDPASGAVIALVEGTAPSHFGPPPLWRPFVLVGLVLLLVGVATRPLARRISRPLEQLTAAARRLGGGDLSARVPAPARPARRADEIGELTGAFNEMADRVERLVHAEKELLANVSHELRSPLARIRVALELLPRTAADEGRVAGVERDLAELDRIIDDVLTTARLAARGLPTTLGTVDAQQLLRDVAEQARQDPLTMGREVRIADGATVRLTADEALLRRALWNLVENAAKYGAPPITLSASRSGERVVLAVSDAGEGIAPADREKVFAAFHRGDTARREAPEEAPGRETPGTDDTRRGVGLGLTLARAVAEAHGGVIAIESLDEVSGRPRGCRVVITIPAGPDATLA